MWIVSLVALSTLCGARPQEPAPPARAATLYERQCALCHGATGRADGFASTYLFPPARDFTRARFRLATTDNGAPSDEDLVAVLRRGIPGSAMPSFGWLAEPELVALAHHVRRLAADGWAEHLEGLAPELTAVERADLAAQRTRPGAPVAVPASLDVGPAGLARGAALFMDRCAPCHGKDGRGRHELLRRDEDGVRDWARDFTAGVLAGPADPASLARRLQVGMHGSAMPAVALQEHDLAALASYVAKLVPADARERLVQRREAIVAARVDGAAPCTNDDPAWQAAPWHELALAPLWWTEGAVVHAYVAALHDGETLALAVRWPDARPDVPESKERPFRSAPYADALAVQLSTEEEPAFFGMAPGDARANLWYWRAAAMPEAESLEALLDLIPHRVGDWWSDAGASALPVLARAWETARIEDDTTAVVPAGARRLDEQAALRIAPEAVPRWRDGEWTVLLRRALAGGPGGELELRPGESLWVSFAVWNGEARDLRAQKAITIWHALVLGE